MVSRQLLQRHERQSRVPWRRPHSPASWNRGTASLRRATVSQALPPWEWQGAMSIALLVAGRAAGSAPLRQQSIHGHFCRVSHSPGSASVPSGQCNSHPSAFNFRLTGSITCVADGPASSCYSPCVQPCAPCTTAATPAITVQQLCEATVRDACALPVPFVTYHSPPSVGDTANKMPYPISQQNQCVCRLQPAARCKPLARPGGLRRRPSPRTIPRGTLLPHGFRTPGPICRIPR